jgi:PmbA protein
MAGVVGADEVRRVGAAALEIDGVDGVEVLFMHEWGGLTRFANSAIHQSTWREDTGLRVRVVTENRVGVAASNDFSPDGARRAAEAAREMARVSAPDPEFPGLAPRADVPDRPDAFDDATASTSPERRADGVEALVARVDGGFRAAGAFETIALEIGLANTEGQFCWAPSTQASISTVVNGGDGGNGFAEAFSPRLDEVDPGEIGGRAFAKAEASQRPRDLKPGAVTAVLEPNAVSTVVGFLAFIGFGGRAIAEGRSCFTGKDGREVAAPSITIRDDALSPMTIGTPFDFEGVPRRPVDLVRDGVFVQGVYDLRTAKQVGTQSTGHGLPAPNPDGPFPLNLFLDPGESTIDELIAGTEHGVLVTRFHYSNVVHPVESIITGMTRDGLFVIEDGEVAYPVKNMRFTQSILEALSNTTGIGRDTELASEFFLSSARVPALRIEGFHFTGASDH